MTKIDIDYDGVGKVKEQLDKILEKIGDFNTSITENSSSISAIWKAEEATNFFKRVETLETMLSNFKTKYEAFSNALDEAVQHYQKENSILQDSIDLISTAKEE